MALQTFTGMTFNEFVGASLSGSDDALVAVAAVVGGTGAGYGTGMSANGTDQDIEIQGTVFGEMSSLVAGSSAFNRSGLALTVGSSGVLTSSIEGVLISGYDVEINNAGNITGGYGILLNASSGNTTSTIVNSGSIISHISGAGVDYHAGIVRVGTETLTVINTGLIKGVSRSFNASTVTSGTDNITNSGVMIGAVLLGDGDDMYDGRLGVVDGIVDGGTGEDLLRGGAGGETLAGGIGNDELEGNGGNDTLDGGAGADLMSGGSGDDVYEVDDAGDTVTEAVNEGDDTVRAGLDWILSNHVERLILTGSADIDGTGNALDNEITGNDGANVLDGGAGADTLTGGAGADSYVVDDAEDKVVEAEDEGDDTVNAALDWTLGDHVENLVLTGSGDLAGTGNALDNVITGNVGNNLLSGLDGADRLIGGDGKDTLDGGIGADTLEGGLGEDVYVVDDAGDNLAELADEGTDTVTAAITWTLGTNFENLTLTGSGIVDGTGNGLANLMIGNSGANTLSGLGGKDTLKGAEGNDTMAGDGGADLLTGGAGADLLTGDAGADRFIFTALADSTKAASGRDTILDFSHGQGDRIDLSALDANNRASGNQAFSLIGESAFTGASGQLRFVFSGGDTLLQADVNGDKAADFSIRLEGEIDLVKADFLL